MACLVELGYVRIGFDQFAKTGDSLAVSLAGGILRHNFQGYTSDTAGALIGLSV